MNLMEAIRECHVRLRRVIREDEAFLPAAIRLHEKAIVKSRHGDYELIEEDSFAMALEAALARNLTPEDPDFML